MGAWRKPGPFFFCKQVRINESRTAALFSVFGVLCFGQGTKEAEVTKAHQEFQRGWSDFDAAKLERLFADDLVWIAFNGEVNSKAVMLSAFKQHRMTHPQREEQTRVRIFGDAGIVTTLMTNQDDRDPSLVRKMYMTEVWAKQKGEWKLASFHSSLVPEARRQTLSNMTGVRTSRAGP
jgi:uncharacterized protein (TIGR02246 family)